MPGTIQVSVLEFKDLPSPSIILKVALGKRKYQTSDVGNFTFPLTTIRDNLVVTVLDAEGNEATVTVIQTMSIVEKVCWNDVFHLDGGGHVHLQFRFILSDAERNRIRSMREAAMKKKQVGIPNLIPGQLEIASSTSDSVVSSPQAGRMVSASSQEASSKSGYSASEIAAKSTSVSLEIDHVDKEKQQAPLEKTPSNVRKLVGAFESSQVQDLKPPIKLSTIKREEKKVGRAGYLKDSYLEDLPEAAEPISGRHNKPSVAGDSKATGKWGDKTESGRSFIRNKITQATNRPKESSAAIESWRQDSSSSEWAKLSIVSERPSIDKSTSISGRAYSFGLSAERQSSDSTSFVEGKNKNGSTEISVQVASTGEPISLEYREEELFLFEKSGMWIFPNDRKRCITTAGKRVMNLLESCNSEARSHQKKRSSSMSGHLDKISAQHGTEHEKKKNHNKPDNLRKSQSEGSSGYASGGLVQQAIKVAVVVGFGVLVFLTRQREPRKSKKDTDHLLFEASKYMDEQILTEEKMEDFSMLSVPKPD